MTAQTEVTTAAEPTVKRGRRRKQLSEGARADRRLGWLLCAPAVVVMIAVAGYPIAYAVYLSLQRYDLRFPQQAHFIGLSNYGAVLSSPYWWHALVVTLLGVAISVPAIFFYTFFKNRLTRITNDTSNLADDLLTQMYHNSKKPAPPAGPSPPVPAATPVAIPVKP